MEFSKRKWGWYLTFFSATKFKLKFLYFKKGHSCSMQRHKNRSELWLFLRGYGQMEGDVPDVYVGGEWHFVERGSWHKFNAHVGTLVLEIQTGICEESDIERAA